MVYCCSYWITISTNKCDSQLYMIAHEILSGSDEYFAILGNYFPNLIIISKGCSNCEVH